MRKIFSILVVSLLLARCFPRYYPNDVGVDELPEYQPDYPEYYKGEVEWDRSREREEPEYDPSCTPPMFEEEDWTQPAYCRSGSSKSTIVEDSSKCPNGCTTHKSGCDIKGNISFNTKEKIYHIPG